MMAGLGAAPLPEFPVQRDSHDRFAAFESLRFASGDDLPFLRKLYRSFRLNDLAPLPWSIEEKQVFIDQQFDMQHRYYVAVFPRANFLIIEQGGLAAGRLYIDLSGNSWHIIDIGLLPEWRNRGLGRALLQNIQNAARSAGTSSLILHVEQMNTGAQSFYQSLNFRFTSGTDTHLGMEWSPPFS